MDEDFFQSYESEDENLRAMEKDIDEFLTSIRENVTNSTTQQNEDRFSDVYIECDSISSDDCFENEQLPSRSDKPANQDHSRKLRNKSFKNKWKVGKGNMKHHGKPKVQSSYHHEEWHRYSGRNLGQSSGEEYHRQKSFSPSWRDEYDSHQPLSPRSDGFHRERSLSPRGDYYQEQSIPPGGSNERVVRIVSPDRKGKYHQQRWCNERGRHEYRRRNFSSVEVDESSQDGCDFKERNFHDRSTASRLRSSDSYSVSQREHRRGSNSPIDWSESYDYDSDFEDETSNQPWRHEENDPYMGDDRDNQNPMSVIMACLQKAIVDNPEVATKVTKACMAVLSKPADGRPESDHECDRDSWAACEEEEAGRVSPQSWRGNRSPSYAESLGASSSRSGYSRHSDRFHSHSERSVLERSLSPDDRWAGRDKYNYPDRHKKARYSPEYKRHDDTRPSTAASEGRRTRKRSFSEHSKSHYEEEFNLKSAFSWSMRKIRKQCEGESSSVVRRALLSLLKVHERECKMYLKKPEAHPDYMKEYREFVDQKTKSIVDLGGDPNGYDFGQDWKKHWPAQMYKHFQESWNTKMHSCTSLLQERCGSGSKSSHSSSKKSSVKQPHEKRQKTHEGNMKEAENIRKRIKKSKTPTAKQDLLEVTCSTLEDQQSTEKDTTILCRKEKMNNEIFSILKLLNHIKHRFNDCEASFDKLYVKAMNLKEDSNVIDDILQSDLPLLEKIDENLKETLEDVNLSLIQKAVIQETHERFKSFLKNSKEINSHSMKIKEVTVKESGENMDASREGTIEGRQIPCCLTTSYSTVIPSQCSNHATIPRYTSCSCFGINQQVSQPRRTLTEISIVGSSERAHYTPENASGASFLLCNSQDGIQFNRDFTPGVMSLEKHASWPRRTLKEICLVGSSSASSASRNVTLAAKDLDITQPPPPGITPPPPGVTPPPPGVSPPPSGVSSPLPPGVTSPSSGVTLPPPDVTPPPPGVTPPPPGVTPPPPSVTPPPSDLSPPPPGVTLPPSGNTTQLHDVTPSCDAALPSSSIKLPSPSITPTHSVTKPLPSSSIKLPSPSITPTHSVTKPPCGVIAPSQSVITTSKSVTTKPPCAVTPQPHNVTLQPSSSDFTQTPHTVTPSPPPPGVSLFSVDSDIHSSVSTLTQAQILGPSSPPPTALLPANILANDKTHKTSQQSCATLTSLEQNSKPSKYEVAGLEAKTDTPSQPSKELLRSTIKDCFISSSLPEESSANLSTKEMHVTTDASAEGSSVSLVPNLSEVLLKMFEVKPEECDKINSDKGSTKADSKGSSSIQSLAKKPIKITIPQFSKRKSMPVFSSITDDQELL